MRVRVFVTHTHTHTLMAAAAAGDKEHAPFTRVKFFRHVHGAAKPTVAVSDFDGDALILESSQDAVYPPARDRPPAPIEAEADVMVSEVTTRLAQTYQAQLTADLKEMLRRRATRLVFETYRYGNTWPTGYEALAAILASPGLQRRASFGITVVAGRHLPHQDEFGTPPPRLVEVSSMNEPPLGRPDGDHPNPVWVVRSDADFRERILAALHRAVALGAEHSPAWPSAAVRPPSEAREITCAQDHHRIVRRTVVANLQQLNAAVLQQGNYYARMGMANDTARAIGAHVGGLLQNGRASAHDPFDTGRTTGRGVLSVTEPSPAYAMWAWRQAERAHDDVDRRIFSTHFPGDPDSQQQQQQQQEQEGDQRRLRQQQQQATPAAAATGIRMVEYKEPLDERGTKANGKRGAARARRPAARRAVAAAPSPWGADPTSGLTSSDEDDDANANGDGRARRALTAAVPAPPRAGRGFRAPSRWALTMPKGLDAATPTYPAYKDVGASLALDTAMEVVYETAPQGTTPSPQARDEATYAHLCFVYSHVAWALYDRIYVRGVGDAVRVHGVFAIHPLLLTPSMLHPALEMHWFLDRPALEDARVSGQRTPYALDPDTLYPEVAHPIAFMAYNWALHAMRAAPMHGQPGRYRRRLVIHVHPKAWPIVRKNPSSGVITMAMHLTALLRELAGPRVWLEHMHEKRIFIVEGEPYNELVPHRGRRMDFSDASEPRLHRHSDSDTD